MDVQRYISSGVIENHVTGLLSETESREVMAAIQQYPEIRAAADAIQQDMERYIEMWAKKPPAALKRQLMERLNKDDVEEAIPVVEEQVATFAEVESFSSNGGMSLQLSPLKMWQYGAIAASVFLLVSMTLNIVAYSNADNYKTRNTALETGQVELTAERDAFKEQLDHTQKENSLMKDPAFKWVKMLGVGKHSGAVATICWNPESKETFVLAQVLPEPPEGKQYQLWAIVNGKLIDAGIFERDSAKALQKVKNVEKVQVFAVTLENKGGSQTPTLDQMFVAGKVAG